jgi:hypothetical protein
MRLLKNRRFGGTYQHRHQGKAISELGSKFSSNYQPNTPRRNGIPETNTITGASIIHSVLLLIITAKAVS